VAEVVVVLVESVGDVVVLPALVVVPVVVLVGSVGSVGSVTVGRVTEGTVVVRQPRTGTQSCGAAGTELEKVPDARSPAPNTATPASPRQRGPN